MWKVIPVTGDKVVKTVVCILSENTFPCSLIRVLKPPSELLGTVKHHVREGSLDKMVIAHLLG